MKAAVNGHKREILLVLKAQNNQESIKYLNHWAKLAYAVHNDFRWLLDTDIFRTVLTNSNYVTQNWTVKISKMFTDWLLSTQR